MTNQPQQIKVPAVMKQGEIEALIQKVHTTLRDSQAMQHQAAWQALAYAKQFGNLNPLVQLINDAPNTFRADKVMRWAKAFGPIRFGVAKDDKGNDRLQADGREIVTASLKKKAKDKDWQLEQAFMVPFYELHKPSVGKEADFNFYEALERVLKRGSKMIEEGKVKGEENINALKGNLTKLEGFVLELKTVEGKGLAPAPTAA
jgi:hypothetical protein